VTAEMESCSTSSKRVSYWVYINLHHRYQHMHPLVLYSGVNPIVSVLVIK